MNLFRTIVIKILWSFVVLGVLFGGVFIFFGAIGSSTAEQSNSVVLIGLCCAAVPYFLVLAVSKLLQGSKD